MPLDTSVKFFHSNMLNVGGPTTPYFMWSRGNTGVSFVTVLLNNFTILDKLLINGFNTQTAASVVVASNVATVTFSGAHGFEDYTVISVSGATPSGLNGEKRITAVSPTVLTYETSGISDQTATGTITVKYAPLGWSYVGATPTTMPITVRSTNINGALMGCTITEYSPNTNYAHGFSLQGYRTATASAVSNAFGSRRAVSFGSNTTGTSVSGSVQWVVWGDDRSVYILVGGGISGVVQTNTNGFIYGFGDISSIITNDPYTAFVFGDETNIGSANEATIYNTTASANLGYNQFSAATTNLQLAALASGATFGSAFCCAEYPLGDGISGAITGGLSSAFPNSTDGSLILARKAIGDGTGLRGYFRGLYVSPQNCSNTFTAFDKVTGTGALSGKKLLVLRHGSLTQATTPGTGVVFVDITGPWT